MKKLLPVIAVLAIGLTACGGANEPASEQPAATPSPSEEVEQVPGKGNIASDGTDFTTLTDEDLKLTTDKTYEFLSSTNATGEVTFLSNDSPEVKEVEDYLNEAIGYHREYLKVDVDNSEGSEIVLIPEVTVEGTDELEYTFQKINTVLDDSEPVLNSDDSYTTADGMKELTAAEYESLTERGRELGKKQRWDVKPGGKATLLFAMEIDEGALPGELYTVSLPVHGVFETVMAKNRTHS